MSKEISKQSELIDNKSKLIINNENKKAKNEENLEKLRTELRLLGIEDEYHVLDDEEAKIYEAERRGHLLR